MSVRQFARIRGCSHESVRLAILDGRLVKAVVYDAKGAPKITDPGLAMRELDATTDPSRMPPAQQRKVEERQAMERAASGGGDASDGGARVFVLSDEAARERHWKANIAELEYRVRSGELVPVSEVEAKFVDAVTAAKTKLLGVPTRIRQQLPHIAAEDIEAIKRLVREALEDLAYGR